MRLNVCFLTEFEREQEDIIQNSNTTYTLLIPPQESRPSVKF